MPPRERDSRGRFVSNRDHSELSEDPTEIVPETDSKQYQSANERDDRSESTTRMAILVAKEVKPTKLVHFNIPNLTK